MNNENEIVTQEEYILSPNAARTVDSFLFKRVLVVFPIIGLLGLLGMSSYLQNTIENIEKNVLDRLLESEKFKVGTEKLSTMVLERATKIGEIEIKLDASQANLRKQEEESKKILEQSNINLEDSRIARENIKEQQEELSRLESEINLLSQSIGNLNSAEKAEAIRLANELVSNLSNSSEFNLLTDIGTDVRKLENEVASLDTTVQTRVAPKIRWPHALNCGRDWETFYILHGSPLDQVSAALYVQVYPGEYRYVRFKADATYLDRAGHNQSSIGCEGKSIEQLKKERRAFQFTMAN